jgi:hypothetical protein
MILDDGLKLAIELYKESGSTVTSLWSLYSGASLALLGYILGSKEPVPGRAKIGLGIVFAIFAISNAVALWRAQSIGYAASNSISILCKGSDLPPSLTATLSNLQMSPPLWAVGFQIFLTVCALAAIYAAHRHDRIRFHPPQSGAAGTGSMRPPM